MCNKNGKTLRIAPKENIEVVVVIVEANIDWNDLEWI